MVKQSQTSGLLTGSYILPMQLHPAAKRVYRLEKLLNSISAPTLSTSLNFA